MGYCSRRECVRGWVDGGPVNAVDVWRRDAGAVSTRGVWSDVWVRVRSLVWVVVVEV